jgi:hypothetical protein
VFQNSSKDAELQYFFISQFSALASEGKILILPVMYRHRSWSFTIMKEHRRGCFITVLRKQTANGRRFMLFKCAISLVRLAHFLRYTKIAFILTFPHIMCMTFHIRLNSIMTVLILTTSAHKRRSSPAPEQWWLG